MSAAAATVLHGFAQEYKNYNMMDAASICTILHKSAKYFAKKYFAQNCKEYNWVPPLRRRDFCSRHCETSHTAPSL